MVTLSIISIFISVIALCVATILVFMCRKKSKVLAQLINSHNTNAGVIESVSKGLSSTNENVEKLAELLSKFSTIVQEMANDKKPQTSKKSIKKDSK
jgi:hypothetical protein